MTAAAKRARSMRAPDPTPPLPPDPEAWRREFAAHLDSDLARATERIAAFAEELVKAPRFRLDNCDSIFEAAATRAVALEVRGALGIDVTLAAIHARALDEALRSARGGSRSTSTTANLMSACMGAAWAAMEELARGYARGEAKDREAIAAAVRP